VTLASERGFTVLALTDHDTTAGLAEARAAAEQHGVMLIDAIELTTTVEPGELHLLGYGIDPASNVLQDALAELRAARAQRAARILARLRELGIDLPGDVITPASPEEAIGRPHIARAMIAQGVVGSVDEAFARFLGRGAPAYVPRDALGPADAIQLIREAGGLAALAHPYSWPAFPDELDALQRVGLGGLEVYYGEYTEQQRGTLAQLAAKTGLVATGGSDYHGPHYREGRELGSVYLPVQVAEAFLAALEVS
jgi:predicted metal-dependent phosphoesterase TrpH